MAQCCELKDALKQVLLGFPLPEQQHAISCLTADMLVAAVDEGDIEGLRLLTADYGKSVSHGIDVRVSQWP